MKMAMILNLVRHGRRQLHTIVSREMIKPSSPTPSHLKAHNLTPLDQLMINLFVPIVAFYPKRSTDPTPQNKTLDLKNSLSQTLTKYYPFAGRYEFEKVAPAHVDCNDKGAEFFEASIDRTLSDFLQNSQHQDLNQFIPYGLNYKPNTVEGVIPLMVQINHFRCGGVAVAVSMSHKMADGASVVRFVDDWANMTRLISPMKLKHESKSPVDPEFITFKYNNINTPGMLPERCKESVPRTFIFPNSKLNELKVKVKAMSAESGQPITNPTRVEALTWLLYKCAVAAASKNINPDSNFKPTGVCHIANIRGQMMEPLAENSIGNYVAIMNINPTNNESELTKPESFIRELKNQKLQLKGIRNIESLLDMFSKADHKELQGILEGCYCFTSMCGYPTSDIDFGWGKPVKTAIPPFYWKNCIILMDTPNGDGIEANVFVGKQDMDILQNDPDLLAYGSISKTF